MWLLENTVIKKSCSWVSCVGQFRKVAIPVQVGVGDSPSSRGTTVHLCFSEEVGNTWPAAQDPENVTCSGPQLQSTVPPLGGARRPLTVLFLSFPQPFPLFVCSTYGVQYLSQKTDHGSPGSLWPAFSAHTHQAPDTCQMKYRQDLPTQESWWGMASLHGIHKPNAEENFFVLDVLKVWLSILKWFKCRIIKVCSNLFVLAPDERWHWFYALEYRMQNRKYSGKQVSLQRFIHLTADRVD